MIGVAGPEPAEDELVHVDPGRLPPGAAVLERNPARPLVWCGLSGPVSLSLATCFDTGGSGGLGQAQVFPGEVDPAPILVPRQERVGHVVEGRGELDVAGDAGPGVRHVSDHVADPGPIEPRHLDGPQEHVHAVVAVGGIGLRLHAEALAIRPTEAGEAGTLAAGVPWEPGDHPLGVLPGHLDELLRHGSVAPEERLLHPHLAHLVEDERARPGVTPVNHRVRPHRLHSLELEREVGLADPVGHLDGVGVTHAAARVPDLAHAEAAVAAARPDDGDPLEAQLPIPVVGQQVGLLSIVADDARHPRDVGLGERRVRVARVDHQDFGLQGDADRDVAVGPVDRPQDSPDLVLVGLLHDLVSGSAPQAVVVAHDQLEGDAAVEIPSPRVPLLDGHSGSLQHGHAQRLTVARAPGGHGHRGLDGADEADLDRLQTLGFRDRPARPGVLHLEQEVLLPRLHPAERLHVHRGPCVGVLLAEWQIGGRVAPGGLDLRHELHDLRIVERDPVGILGDGVPGQEHEDQARQQHRGALHRDVPSSVAAAGADETSAWSGRSFRPG